MEKFKDFKKPHGTGTERRKKWDKMMKDEGWGECFHKCPVHGVFSHPYPPVPPHVPCHIPAIAECLDCKLIPFTGEFDKLKLKLSKFQK